MRAQEFLKEDILDDLLNDFDYEPKQKPTSNAVTIPSEKKRRVTFKGQKSGHAEYVYKEELPPNVTIEYIAKLFAQKNIIVRDSSQFEFPVDELYQYREYDRSMRDGYTGKMSQDEYNDLKQSIKQGFDKSQYLIVHLTRKQNGDVDVYLGEGNHRLKIARELGIKTLPVRFGYSK